MFGIDGLSPIKIEVTLGMLEHPEVITALSTLLAAMGKAQEANSAKLDQALRENYVGVAGNIPMPLPTPRRQ